MYVCVWGVPRADLPANAFCTRIFMYICMHVCMYVVCWAETAVPAYACTYVCMFVCVWCTVGPQCPVLHFSLQACMHACMHEWCMYVCGFWGRVQLLKGTPQFGPRIGQFTNVHVYYVCLGPSFLPHFTSTHRMCMCMYVPVCMVYVCVRMHVFANVIFVHVAIIDKIDKR